MGALTQDARMKNQSDQMPPFKCLLDGYGLLTRTEPAARPHNRLQLGPEMPPEAQMEHTEKEGPVTRCLLVALFDSLKDDLHTVKRELSQDLKAVQKDLVETEDEVSTMENNASGRDKGLENLQQEVIHLI
ncbi:hypothetical protein NDU88_004741 [Pleurodeles waltl]|uniref:Uncharacterized protein n=1 Tax=Pleurodeles waltl TaxID=8319 RepID=A0AAV7TA87_PLEWA|nr:hypothetical protein NDU88_004741 [Pleurodeles waltl]